MDQARSLAAAALEAAKSGGATYANVQLRVVRREYWSFGGLGYDQPNVDTIVGMGVRALVNGYWGFAGQSGVFTVDAAARLGQESATQARIASSRGKPYRIVLAPVPVIPDGKWNTPIEVDPFAVSFEEKADFFTAMIDFIQRQRLDVGAWGGTSFQRDERITATSEGAFVRQTVYITDGTLTVGVPPAWQTERNVNVTADFLTSTGAGWEYIRHAPFKDNARQLIDEALRLRITPQKPVDVGRYDVVFDAKAMKGLVDNTIGMATELDRALGYLANEQGTSYLNDPLEMLGTFTVGSPLLNVTANRSMLRGCATVQWDDEATEPRDITLVKNGVLNDFQTTRESSSWIAEYYQRKGTAVQSNGCAGVYKVTAPVSQVSPNLVMQPGSQDLSFDDLVRDTRKGLAVMGGGTGTDHQLLNGFGSGRVHEIVDGKLGAIVSNAQYIYRSPELWKNLVGIGGPRSARNFGATRSRGNGTTFHTVSTVPAKITGVAVTDRMKKSS